MEINKNIGSLFFSDLFQRILMEKNLLINRRSTIFT